MANWPTDDLTTAHLDAGTDDPSQARSELLALAQKVKTMLAAAGTAANNVLLLGASGQAVIIADSSINGVNIGKGGANIATNTRLGVASLGANTTGSNNTAVGVNALTANTTADQNTALGSNALAENTTGGSNVAVGFEALRYSTSAVTNTAVGVAALRACTTGGSNVAVGYSAGQVLTSGIENVAVGRGANLSSGNRNTALGYLALSQGVSNSGSNNTAVGNRALSSDSTGENNTALGYQAGNTITTGSNNTALGNAAAASSATVSNEVTLGNSSVTTLRCQVALTVLSDERDKKDIEDVPIGMDFINALRPVKFTWARRDGTKEGIQEAGFIAQELDAVQQAFGAEDYMRLVYKSNPEKLEATPANLLPIMVKAIQELSAQNAELSARISALGG